MKSRWNSQLLLSQSATDQNLIHVTIHSTRKRIFIFQFVASERFRQNLALTFPPSPPLSKKVKSRSWSFRAATVALANFKETLEGCESDDVILEKGFSDLNFFSSHFISESPNSVILLTFDQCVSKMLISFRVFLVLGPWRQPFLLLSKFKSYEVHWMD